MTSISLIDRNECAICNSHDSFVFIPFPEIPVVRCRKCGFIYSSKVLPRQYLTSYYENNFGSQRHLQGQIVNSMINSMVLTKLLNIHDINNILDVGTGYGFLLNELCKHRKLDATGVELSRHEAQYARSKLGLNVINSPLTESNLTKRSYDLVTSFEVIEHVPYPIEFIQQMSEYVKHGGYLLIMTDNFESRMAKSLWAGFPKWIPHSHISHFSPTTLARAIESTKDLTIHKSMSYTPWEILLRNAYYNLRGIRKTPSEAFDLISTRETEMSGTYNLFFLRKLVNRRWAQVTISNKLDGDLMYFLSRKTV